MRTQESSLVDLLELFEAPERSRGIGETGFVGGVVLVEVRIGPLYVVVVGK